MSIDSGEVGIVGGGPTGMLLAIVLERRGVRTTVYESRPDPRLEAAAAGRSINLALADRGIHALRYAGVYDDVESLMMPMRGRLIHQRHGPESLQLYGQRPNEVIYSVSRQRLNQALVDAAVRRHAIDVRFEQRLHDVDLDSGVAVFHDMRGGRPISVRGGPWLACDGAGSVMRRRMAEAGVVDALESPLDHGYKELSIPANPDGTHRFAPDALHLWPRGDFMLIALPNVDGSFTATLFLPHRGAVSFDALKTTRAVEAFAAENFPDARSHMPAFAAQFLEHPLGFMGTVRAHPWSTAGTAALVGDAAHAIVPFHGQGMNCCFEDCVELDGCLALHDTWPGALAEFYARRKPNTDAIAAMALENYAEMRERVVDPKFQLQRSLALELERRFPDRFIPRYSMVMFHHEIGYRMAERRGVIQTELLAELTADASSLDDIDFGRAERTVIARLEPL